MNRLLTLLLAIGALLVALPARAADVIIYYNSTAVSSTDVSYLSSALTAAGATVTTTATSSTTSWPTSYSGYKLVVNLVPPATFSSTQISAVKSFINGGGRYVVGGEWESYAYDCPHGTPSCGYYWYGFHTEDDYARTLLTGLGASISLDSSSNAAGSGCAAGVTLATDQITSGETDGYVAAAETITGGTTLVSYSGSAIVAAQQLSGSSGTRPPYDLVVSGDSNFLVGSCTGSTTSGQNYTFWKNLYYWGVCDSDKDTYYSSGSSCGGTDCDDATSSVHPGATETCNGVDDDCNGTIDDGLSTTWYADSDGDGYGNASSTKSSCTAPSGYVTDKTDCDDTAKTIHPGATETCNSKDDDCDGSIDEGVTSTYYRDADGDGYGTSSTTTTGCSAPSGYVSNSSDCDDTSKSISPAATEVCNSVDDDCDGSIDEGVKSTYYRDADGDGYGTSSTTTTGCSAPSGYVANSSDCDDASKSISPAATETCNGVDDDCDGSVDEGVKSTWYYDADGDGYGTSSTTSAACSAPSGYVSNSSDCDDTRSSVHPGATETCNSIDDDCDGLVDESGSTVYYRDADGDGYGDATKTTTGCSAPTGYVSDSTDCDDTSKTVSPAGTETCNGVDDDCDGVVDEGVKTTYYKDADGDGYGTSGTTSSACSAPSGYVANSTDCDDSKSSVNPGAAEICDSVDNDCDGSIDEGVKSTYYADTDGDGYGTSWVTASACSAPTGYASNKTDCDDADSTVHPGATETCNGVDDDCNGIVDDTTSGKTYYADADGDGYGDSTKSTTACSAPTGYVTVSGDCDDTRSTVSPAGVETCNSLDDDCDGTVDDGVTTTYYRDADGDGYGDATKTSAACSAPSGYVTDETDCDDTSASVHPGATEIAGDGIDQDCDGSDPAGTTTDADGDGHDATAYGGDDCDDHDATIYPGTPTAEAADGVDQDCDGTVDEGTDWADDDGDGYTEAGGDCDDADATVFPGGTETCDGVDQDCDGTIDEGTSCYDDDGDGVTEDDGDCADGDAAVHPGATEIDGNGVDDDCDGSVDGGVVDSDHDGYTAAGGDCDDADAATHPGATEVVDNRDNDCDGTADEGTDNYDDDGDGYTELFGDCDDSDADVYDGAPETKNGRDDDCDGEVDEGTDAYDDDGDGYTEEGGDCDDFDADVHPGQAEADNGVDDDCDGDIDEDFSDVDGDGYTVAQGDCDDTNGWIAPGLEEMCDGLDNDCNGVADDHSCGATDDTGVPTQKGSCGCDGGAASVIGLWPLIALLALRRRSRRERVAAS